MATKEKKDQTIRNVWTIITQSSAIDRDTNSLSLFDVVEEINLQITGPLPENAAFPINTQLVSLWEREESGTDLELKVRVVLKDPKGENLMENEASLKLEPAHIRSRFRIQFQGMRITSPGVYKYALYSLEPAKTEGKDLLASVPIEVKITNKLIKSPLSPN